MRNVLIAWIATLVILGGGAAALQFTYTPPRMTADHQADTAPDTTASEGTEDQGDQSEAPAEDHSDATGDDPVDEGDDDSIVEETPVPSADSSGIAAVRDSNPTPRSEPGVTRFTSDNPDESNNSLSDLVENPPSAANNASDNIRIASVDTSLIEDGRYGPLPIIWNQRVPWQVYGRPFDRPGDRPRISIVIAGLGLAEEITRRALEILPPEVSVAFSPYGQNLDQWVDLARERGHESLLMVPMEPLDYPVNDPGPHTLMSDLTPTENVDRLHFILARIQGYVGIVNDMGSKFTADPDAIRPIMQDLQRRGIIFLDSRATRMTLAATSAREFGVPFAVNDRYIDNDISAAQIDRYLRELENVALRSGNAVGIGRPYPLTVARITEWAATLEAKGIDLAPITAIANRQDVR